MAGWCIARRSTRAAPGRSGLHMPDGMTRRFDGIPLHAARLPARIDASGPLPVLGSIQLKRASQLTAPALFKPAYFIVSRPISTYSLSWRADVLQDFLFSTAPPSTACTPNSCAISVTVFTPRTASRPILALNSAVCTRRLSPSLICCHSFRSTA